MRPLWIAVGFVLTSIACKQTPTAEAQQSAQRQERRELEEQQERQRLAQVRQREAQAALPQQRARQEAEREAQVARVQQEQTAVEALRLDAVMEQACAGIGNGRRDQCPVLAAEVRSVRDVNNGVGLHMQVSVGNRAQFDRRLACYRALGTVRSVRGSATTTAQPLPPTACLIDLPGVSVESREAGGSIEVQMTAPTPEGVAELRTRARLLEHRVQG